MNLKKHAVLLSPETPASLLAMLKNDIRVYPDMRVVFAASAIFAPFGFVELSIHRPEDTEVWKFWVPSRYVLAVAEISPDPGSVARLGFQP